MVTLTTLYMEPSISSILCMCDSEIRGSKLTYKLV